VGLVLLCDEAVTRWVKTVAVAVAEQLFRCAAFGANAAWFRLCFLTYNLLPAMKVLALPPPFEDARPKRLRFAVFNLPARLFSHVRKLLARVAEGLLERANMLIGRAHLRATYAT
jgi:hypothetical protein